MSEFHNIAANLVADRASATTDPVRNLRDGSTFTAEIDPTPDALTLVTELGEDYRNVVLLHVTDDAEAANILPQDEVEFTLFGRRSKARIIKLRDNPANVQNDFWAMQLGPQDT